MIYARTSSFSYPDTKSSIIIVHYDKKKTQVEIWKSPWMTNLINLSKMRWFSVYFLPLRFQSVWKYYVTDATNENKSIWVSFMPWKQNETQGKEPRKKNTLEQQRVRWMSITIKTNPHFSLACRVTFSRSRSRIIQPGWQRWNGT